MKKRKKMGLFGKNGLFARKTGRSVVGRLLRHVVHGATKGLAGADYGSIGGAIDGGNSQHEGSILNW